LNEEGKLIHRNMYVIAVQNLNEAAKYYESVLGFKVHSVGDDGWRIFERDGCQIMAGHCPDAKPIKSESWGMREFGIRTNDGHRIMFGEEIDG